MIKKLLTVVLGLSLGVASVTCFQGCQSTDLPSEAVVNAYGKGVGFATGIALKLAKADTNVVNGVCYVLAEIKGAIPAKDQTFEELWPAKLDPILADLVAKGKIDQMYVEPIKVAFNYVCKGLDYARNKHPIWFEYEDLAKAAIDGFVEGFHVVLGFNATQAQVDAAELSANEVQVRDICNACQIKYLPMSARRRR